MITIRGKADKISREEARAWIHATLCILAYHNVPLTRKITVSFVSRISVAGDWSPLGLIRIRKHDDPDDIFTTIVHELIHECCGDFAEDSDEKCTSTLTARIKAEVALIAQRLLDNTYKRAAWLAHTKIAYRTKPGQDDFYDPDQDRPVAWRGRYRGKKGK